MGSFRNSAILSSIVTAICRIVTVMCRIVTEICSIVRILVALNCHDCESEENLCQAPNRTAVLSHFPADRAGTRDAHATIRNRHVYAIYTCTPFTRVSGSCFQYRAQPCRALKSVLPRAAAKGVDSTERELCTVNTRYRHTLGTPKMCACNVIESATL